MIRDERGLSLPELLLVIAIIALITAFLATTIYQIVNITNRGNNELAVQHDLRNAAVWLNRDVLSASLAEISGSQMVLKAPDFSDGTLFTRTITYEYSPETENLIRNYDGSSLVIARHIASNPFPPPGTIDADDTGVVTVTLRSREGNVPGEGRFGLKMRAGGSIQVVAACQITGAENLDINPSSKTVGWDITNNSGDTASIEQAIIEWPGVNGVLGLITFGSDGNSILTEERYPPSTAIVKPGWAPGDRTIDSDGIPKTLKLWFLSDAEDVYSIEITFDNGCVVSFN